MELATVNLQLDFSERSLWTFNEYFLYIGKSAGVAFPFYDQADIFQSFGSGSMENQCHLGLLDTVLPHNQHEVCLSQAATEFLGGESPKCAAQCKKDRLLGIMCVMSGCSITYT